MIFCTLAIVTAISLCIYADTISIPSNCIGLSDGYYYLKLLKGDQYPIIYAKCSNEYIILDISLDQDIKSYFNSFEMYHISVAGPSNQYPINWDDWFLPNIQSVDDNNIINVYNKYLISPDCDSCDIDHERQLYDDKTAYMMTGSMFGCFWIFKNDHKFDQDFNSYQCYYDVQSTNDNIKQQVGDFIKYPLSDQSDKEDWDNSGQCAFNVRSAHLEITSIDHEACTLDYTNEHGIEYGYHLKPSIGTNGKHCVCTQSHSNTADMVQIDSIDLQTKQQEIQQKKGINMNRITVDDETASSEADIIYYLYQNDFEYGTYRITKPGRYVVMEDILFNPNTGSSTKNNVNDDKTAWRPHEDQQDIYPGAGQFRDPYFMGFFSAITIETNDVILDLNDHTVAMDEVFYYQQRWFTIISLTSQYFLPGQGIGFFGANPKFASNVIIKDGTLGLTSHHCIHGNFNKNILIEHIVCKDFETHGIQLNGFDHITIRNVEIGPSSTKQYLRGEYGFARALLPRLQKVADENPDKTIKFDQREKEMTMKDLTEELIRKTNLIFDYVYNGNEPISSSLMDQKEWINIKQLFYNPSGLPDGASMYGIYLNTNGENVMSYDLNANSFSNQALLENIEIHDMRHKMSEYIRVSTKTMIPFGSIYLNPLQAPYDATQMFYSLKSEDLTSNPRYKGSIITDILLALSEFTDNWDYLQSQLIFKDQTLPWAKGDDLDALNDNLVIGCNNDVMLQSGKGLMGIRIDGVQNAKLSNIEIYNLFQETHLGSEACGEYTSFDPNLSPFGGGHISQKLPMQIGFSGNTLQGIVLNAADNIKISDINIHSLQSHTGDVLGIAVWPSVNLGIDGDIIIDDIHSGWLIPEKKDELQWDSRPNRSPMACGIFYIDEYYSKDTGLTYISNVMSDSISNRDMNIHVSNVYGFTYCNGNDDIKTMIGQYIASDNNEGDGDDDQSMNNNDDDTALGDDDVSDEFQQFDTKPSGDHILIGTIIACSILFCGFITMGYIAYIYCQHKKKQTETEERAQLLLEQAQQETIQRVTLQTATNESNHESNYQSNYQSFHLNNGIEEEQEEEEQNERTPLIKNIPAFDRLNL